MAQSQVGGYSFKRFDSNNLDNLRVPMSAHVSVPRRHAGQRHSGVLNWATTSLPKALILTLLSGVIYGATSEEIDHAALVRQLSSETDESARRVLFQRLLTSGEDGLAATRAALKTETKPKVKERLQRLAAWQVARKILPTLQRGQASGLRFDGQYDELNSQGPEVAMSLMLLANDEATHIAVRLASCQALADVNATSLLGSLRELFHDPLAPALLRDRVGILMAILGDTHAVEQELKTLEPVVAQNDRRDPRLIGYNERLAELYYEIRDYEGATRCYDRILDLYEQIYEAASKRDIKAEAKVSFLKQLAVRYYNAACSSTLNGDLEKARSLLKKCIKYDPSHFSNIELDGDFKKLRESEGFSAFQEELEKSVPSESL